MHIPLFDSRKKKVIKTVQSMLNYPIEFFSHPRNKHAILDICCGNEIAIKVVEALILEVEQVCPFIDFAGGIDDGKTHLSSALNILTLAQSSLRSTNFTGIEIDGNVIKEFHKEVEINNAESLSGISILNVDETGKRIIVSKLLDFVWLVNHLSLYFLGAIKLQSDNKDSFCFSVINPEHFHSLWFASALEKKSITASTIAIKQYAELTLKPELIKENIESFQLLQARVLSTVAQHWRLSADELISSIFHEIADLVLILTKVVQKCLFKVKGEAVSRSYYQRLAEHFPERKDILRTFDMIIEHQLSLAFEDRLFNVVNGELKLGDVETIRGMLSQALFFAVRRFGESWNKNVEDQQKQYLVGYLRKFPHLEVLEFQFNTNSVAMTIDPKLEKLDVDLFVRDKSKGVVYAVQLKHVSALHSSGVSFWVNMLLHHDRKLNVGVLQLQNLKNELAVNHTAVQYLTDKGLTNDEIKNLIPVIVHNVGSIDMIPLQEGIWVYDLHTFRKVLTDQSALTDKYETHSYTSYQTSKINYKSLRLDQPRSIIETYINDPNFRDLKLYDFAKNIKREVVMSHLKFTALGIGI
jgi:hypothetical protein